LRFPSRSHGKPMIYAAHTVRYDAVPNIPCHTDGT
jgi:hypothetical protein